eukprot:m.47130 g.47130  ORF g.47130 m.47130 type:complete len:662 (-) comp15208_c0_seq1:592-2577(-)
MSSTATPTSDAVCTALSVCRLLSDGHGTYMTQPATFTSDRICKPLTMCDKDQFVSKEATRTSNRVCTVLTECDVDTEKVVSPPTSTTDRECAQNSESQEADATASERLSATSGAVIGTVALACILLLMLVVLFVGYRKQLTDEKDVSGLDDETLTPVSTAMLLAQKQASGLANDVYPMAGVLVPRIHAGTEKGPGDRLWRDFRRATAFDRLYFGNALMQATDIALEDIYAILQLACPPRTFFGHLRAVGDRFAQQEADRDAVIDDVVDFLCLGMPDVLVERAMDVCARGGQEDSLYAQIDDWVPYENPFWEENGGLGYRLRPAAAQRELHRVDPIYFEASDGAQGGTAEYDTARLDDPDGLYGCTTYGFHPNRMYDEGGNSGTGYYEASGANGTAFDDGIYSDTTGDMYDNHVNSMYGMDALTDNQMGDHVYGFASANSEVAYSVADSSNEDEHLYGVLNTEYNNMDTLSRPPTVYGFDEEDISNADSVYNNVHSNQDTESIYGLDDVSDADTGQIYDNSPSIRGSQSIYGVDSTGDSEAQIVQPTDDASEAIYGMLDVSIGGEDVYENNIEAQPYSPDASNHYADASGIELSKEHGLDGGHKEPIAEECSDEGEDGIDTDGSHEEFEGMEDDFLAMERDGITVGFGEPVTDLDAGYLPVG